MLDMPQTRVTPIYLQSANIYVYALVAFNEVFPLSLFLAHLSRRLIGELIVYKGILCPSVRKHFQTTSPLKPRSRFFSYFTYRIYRSGERIIAFFVLVG